MFEQIVRNPQTEIHRGKFTEMAAEASKSEKEHAKILNELQSLRNDQRNIVSNISSLELDLKEHK